jgi:hypothetical protein
MSLHRAGKSQIQGTHKSGQEAQVALLYCKQTRPDCTRNSEPTVIRSGLSGTFDCASIVVVKVVWLDVHLRCLDKLLWGKHSSEANRSSVDT